MTQEAKPKKPFVKCENPDTASETKKGEDLKPRTTEDANKIERSRKRRK